MVGLNRPRNVVAHETKASDSRVCLHDTTQGSLSILGHRISLIQYNYFIGWTRVGFPIRRHSLFPGRLSSKVLDFLSDYADPTLIGCVQFQHAGFEVIRTKQSPCEGKNGGGFPGAWWTIEQHVGKLLIEELAHTEKLMR